ncbi:MAG: hypothetical protein E7536_09170 [Ruminococcaceae bacterium]|nr:hypothetical protein [Oscillospiraceae bacterium]
MQKEHAASLNYEAEFHRACETNERLKLDIESLKSQYKGLENSLSEAEKELAFLKGQIKAFEFCIAKGK